MATGQPGPGALPGLILYGFGGEDDGTIRAVPLSASIAVTRTRLVPLVAAISGTATHYVPLVAAISRTVAVAARAPYRPTQMPDILSAFPPSLFDHDPRPVPALVVTVGASWRVDGDLLEISGGGTPFACDLREFTLGQLATALTTAGYTTTASAGFSALTATILLDGSGRFADDTRLYAFSTVLYRLLRSIVLVWDRVADDLDAGMRQLDVRQASGQWLDWWGSLYGVPRPNLEGDSRYRTRIAYYSVRPRANNVAIQGAILAIFGLASTVVDDFVGAMRCVTDEDDPGSMDMLWDDGLDPLPLLWDGYNCAFTVTVTDPADPATLTLIRALVDRWRAAGTTATVVQG